MFAAIRRRMGSQRQNHLLTHLEGEYAARLYIELQRCVDGQWGLFTCPATLEDLGPYHWSRQRTTEVSALLDLGEEITDLRESLGFTEPFRHYARLCAMRASLGPNSPAEPKLARALLAELDFHTPGT